MTPDTPALKPLPIGIQSFARLREDGYLYVDKTADIHRLVTSTTTIFLSRPRRFGKSLLLSTLEELFKGNEPLFRGLAIHDKWDWSKKHPIIRIDWTSFGSSSVNELRILLGDHLQYVAEEYGVTLKEELGDRRFAELIRKLRQKTGQQVVVLVDEYDKLMLDALTDEKEFTKARLYLRSVYTVLKATSEHLRFIFLTGVSRFSGLSIFSGLNNLNDITLDPEFATLCGYTQDELEESFSDYIETTSKKLNSESTRLLADMKLWYNGYSWDGETSVYNPFSILLFFKKKDFDNFWFQTGTPSFLLEVVKKDSDVLTLVESKKIYNLKEPDANPQKPNLLSLLFQTGYLTIKSIQRIAVGELEHTLGFPNTEVRKSFLTSLLSIYSNENLNSASVLVNAMRRELSNGDVVAFEKNLRILLAGIPYSLTSKETESHYHVIMITWLRLLGFKTQGDVMTDKGRIDAVWELPNQVIIIEIKLGRKIRDKEKLLDAALAQIKAKGYADAYLNFPGKVSILGVAIAGKEPACRLEVLKAE